METHLILGKYTKHHDAPWWPDTLFSCDHGEYIGIYFRLPRDKSIEIPASVAILALRGALVEHLNFQGIHLGYDPGYEQWSAGDGEYLETGRYASFDEALIAAYEAAKETK